jgi:hypothetical protein
LDLLASQQRNSTAILEFVAALNLHPHPRQAKVAPRIVRIGHSPMSSSWWTNRAAHSAPDPISSFIVITSNGLHDFASEHAFQCPKNDLGRSLESV